jgi:hypothetical protein
MKFMTDGAGLFFPWTPRCLLAQEFVEKKASKNRVF